MCALDINELCPACSVHELSRPPNGPFEWSESSSNDDADDADVPLPLWLDEFRNVSTTREAGGSNIPRRRNIHRPFTAGALNPTAQGRNPAHVAYDIHIADVSEVGAEGPDGEGRDHGGGSARRPWTAHTLSPEKRRERMLSYRAPKPKMQDRASSARGVGRFIT
jgi:hypothetical protein